MFTRISVSGTNKTGFVEAILNIVFVLLLLIY